MSRPRAAPGTFPYPHRTVAEVDAAIIEAVTSTIFDAHLANQKHPSHVARGVGGGVSVSHEVNA